MSYLSNGLVAPETGVVQWGVAMFIDGVDVSFVLNQLQYKTKIETKN
jgi:hypothetical protein